MPLTAIENKIDAINIIHKVKKSLNMHPFLVVIWIKTATTVSWLIFVNLSASPGLISKRPRLFLLYGRFDPIWFLVVTVTVVSPGFVAWVTHRYGNVLFPLCGGISACDYHPVSHTPALLGAIIWSFRRPSQLMSHRRRRQRIIDHLQEFVAAINALFCRAAAHNVKIYTNNFCPTSW